MIWEEIFLVLYPSSDISTRPKFVKIYLSQRCVEGPLVSSLHKTDLTDNITYLCTQNCKFYQTFKTVKSGKFDNFRNVGLLPLILPVDLDLVITVVFETYFIMET